MNIESRIKSLIDSCKIISCDYPIPTEVNFLAPASLLVYCPTKSVYSQISRGRKELARILRDRYRRQQKDIKSITIRWEHLGASLRVSSPTSKLPIEMITTTAERQLVVPKPQHELIEECLGYEGACGIVRMSDHKGLFSNTQIVLSSNAHPNDWLGKKMSDYWIEPELGKYLERLVSDGELKNYCYVARMFSGENARLTVNARTVIWNGELARMVKTVSRELLA